MTAPRCKFIFHPSEHVSNSFALPRQRFALFHLFVLFAQYLPKDVAHYDAEPIGRDANRVGALVTRTPGFLPHVSVHAPRSSAREVRRTNEKYSYEPAMLPSCENAFTNASATARFDADRAKVPDVHAKKQINPA